MIIGVLLTNFGRANNRHNTHTNTIIIRVVREGGSIGKSCSTTVWTNQFEKAAAQLSLKWKCVCVREKINWTRLQTPEVFSIRGMAWSSLRYITSTYRYNYHSGTLRVCPVIVRAHYCYCCIHQPAMTITIGINSRIIKHQKQAREFT